MRPSRARKGFVSRSVPRKDIEERLDRFIRLAGSEAMNRLRDDIRSLSKTLDMENEAAELAALIGSLLGTRTAKLHAPAAIARQHGRPFDTDRMDYFHSLHAALRDHPPVTRLALDDGSRGNDTLAFFEAYFPILSRALNLKSRKPLDIVFHNVIPSERPQRAMTCLALGVSCPTQRKCLHAAKCSGADSTAQAAMLSSCKAVLIKNQRHSRR